MSTLPVLLRKPRIIILGGGAVALQKATVLRNQEIQFSLISLDFCRQFDAFEQKKTVKQIEVSDLDHCNVVIDATGCDSVGHILEGVQKNRYILVNRVDNPQQCNFYFSSLLRYGSLKIAISTDGASPTIGQFLRSKVDALLPCGLQQLIERIKDQRAKGHINPTDTRNQLMTLFTQVYLIECRDVQKTLSTFDNYSQLLKLSMVVYQNIDCSPLSANSNFEHVVVEGPGSSYDCQLVYDKIRSYYPQGQTIGVMIPSGAMFSDHVRYFTTHLNDDGVKFEVIVQQ